MANAFKTDVDSLAAAYLRNRVNNNIAPQHAGWRPTYANPAYLDSFDAEPPASRPSQGWLGPNLQGGGGEVRTAVLALSDYYTRIVRGRYGLVSTPPQPSYGPAIYNAIPYTGTWGQNNCPWLNESGRANAPGTSMSFTLALRLEQFWRPLVASANGGAVSAGNMRIAGWASGTVYASNTWYNVARLDTGEVFGQVNFTTAYKRYGDRTYYKPAFQSKNGMVQVTETGWVLDPALTGVYFRTMTAAGFDYGYFAVNESYPGMLNHKNSVRADLNTIPGLSGNASQGGVAALYDQAWNTINYRRDTFEADLTVCHNSCHTAPHSSRGRR